MLEKDLKCPNNLPRGFVPAEKVSSRQEQQAAAEEEEEGILRANVLSSSGLVSSSYIWPGRLSHMWTLS